MTCEGFGSPSPLSRTLVAALAIESSHTSVKKAHRRKKKFVIKFYGAEIRCKRVEKKNLFFVCSVFFNFYISSRSYLSWNIFEIARFYNEAKKKSPRYSSTERVCCFCCANFTRMCCWRWSRHPRMSTKILQYRVERFLKLFSNRSTRYFLPHLDSVERSLMCFMKQHEKIFILFFSAGFLVFHRILPLFRSPEWRFICFPNSKRQKMFARPVDCGGEFEFSFVFSTTSSSFEFLLCGGGGGWLCQHSTDDRGRAEVTSRN